MQAFYATQGPRPVTLGNRLPSCRPAQDAHCEMSLISPLNQALDFNTLAKRSDFAHNLNHNHDHDLSSPDPMDVFDLRLDL